MGMNNHDELNISIAEALGWEWRKYGDSMAWYDPCGRMVWLPNFSVLSNITKPANGLPKYSSDLNVVHRAILDVVYGPSAIEGQSNSIIFNDIVDKISAREEIPTWEFDAKLYAEALLKLLKMRG